MKIAMFTNLYLPTLGGVAISVDRFAEAYRRRGHEVLIVAPSFPGQPDPQEEPDVERVPAIQNFNGTDFSVALPPGPKLSERLDHFAPELIHSHHPFLLGDAAVRAATHRNLPLVYTHHTMYEYYTHYVPMDSKAMRNYVVQLSTRYAQFCDRVIAPSRSVAAILRRRGVTRPIDVVPTGVVIEDFDSGRRDRGRRKAGMAEEPFVIGHVGRLTKEKNLHFLVRAVARGLKRIDGARFLVVGEGDLEDDLRAKLDDRGVGDRSVFAGKQTGRDLADLYAAMDVFAFSSKSETQGMVLAESLAAGTPVVALDAPGAREVVDDGANGVLVETEEEEAFADALEWVGRKSDEDLRAMRARARRDAEAFSLDRCAEKALEAYGLAMRSRGPACTRESLNWEGLLEAIRREWEIWSNRAASLGNAISRETDPRDEAS